MSVALSCAPILRESDHTIYYIKLNYSYNYIYNSIRSKVWQIRVNLVSFKLTKIRVNVGMGFVREACNSSF